MSYHVTMAFENNISKTKILILGGNNRLNNKMFTLLNGNAVEIVEEFKYLSLLFTQDGRFVQNTKTTFSSRL